jgi:glycosidase
MGKQGLGKLHMSRISVWLLCACLLIGAGNALGAPTPESEAGQDPASLPARPAPEWVTRGVIYQIQPRAFTPEGTLRAATARLPKVAEVGVDVVYLCPVFVSDDDRDRQGWSPRQKASGMNNPRNPYRMKDYYHVDPEYGSDEDLKAFVAEAHRLQLRVLLDMVYLHCGPNAVFLEEHPNFVERDADGRIIVASWGFPKINHEDPELREYLWKNMEYFVEEFDVDGFRCDVAYRIPLDFWETARDRLKRLRPDVCILAEASTQRPADQLKAFDLNYGFNWFSALRNIYDKGAPASSLRKTVKSDAAKFPRGARFTRYIDNHDIANDCFNNRLEKKWGTERVNLGLVACFTFDGVPFLYNGQEVADAARHSIFGRAPIDWANGETPAGKARFAFCQELCAMRHSERALTDGALVWLDNDRPEAVLSFARRTSEEEVISVLNLSERQVTVGIAMPELELRSVAILLSDQAEVVKDENVCTLRLESFGYFVGKRK